MQCQGFDVSQPTRVISLREDSPDLEVLAEAARILREGGLVAFAAETVYGLGADATNPAAVARIYEAKGRPATNPLIVHAHSLEHARTCVSGWPAQAERLAAQFWPGPLTLVLPRSSLVTSAVSAGQQTVGIRVPATHVARTLIELTGRPIAAPSANRSTGISPTEAWHVSKDLAGKVDLILDSGKTCVGIESTVVDLTTQPPVLLRPGTITNEQLNACLGPEVLSTTGVGETAGEHAGPLKSPGLLSVHYAPRTPTFRVDRNAEGFKPPRVWQGRWALLVLGSVSAEAERMFDNRETPPMERIVLATPREAEAELYSTLQSIDERDFDYLVIVPPPDLPAWVAVRDRVGRASRPWPGEGGLKALLDRRDLVE